jgi:hypothetical protein
MVLTATLTGTLVQAGAAVSVNWVQAGSAQVPAARQFAHLTFDSLRARSVLFGGAAGWTMFGDTWEWNGTAWTQRFPAVSPPALYGGGMAFDSVRGRSVLFGGATVSATTGYTWEWDGTSWTQKFPALSPPGRAWTAMAFDSVRGRTILFGGQGMGISLGDTWEFDGVNWTRLFPATSPSPRYGQAMAFDSIRGRIVLFGGNAYNGRVDETWEWDGTNWIQRIATSAPFPRFWHTMAFDSRQGNTVLFGGDHLNSVAYKLGPINDTWLWDGSQWTQVFPSTLPRHRAQHTMAYDSARGRTVLFGGSLEASPVDTLYNDTWELVTATVKVDQTITFLPLTDQTFGAPPFAVSATSSSGLPVSFGAAGQCTVLGSTVTITGGGSCSITASQAGSADYNAAVPVTRTFNIACFPSQMVFALPGDPVLVPADLVFTSQQPATGGGCTGTFEMRIPIGPTPTTVGTGTFTATTLGTVVTANMVGTLAPPFNAVTFNAALTLDTATQTGTIVEVFATPDGPLTIIVTFAKVAHAYVITGATVTP